MMLRRDKAIIRVEIRGAASGLGYSVLHYGCTFAVSRGDTVQVPVGSLTATGMVVGFGRKRYKGAVRQAHANLSTPSRPHRPCRPGPRWARADDFLNTALGEAVADDPAVERRIREAVATYLAGPLCSPERTAAFVKAVDEADADPWTDSLRRARNGWADEAECGCPVLIDIHGHTRTHHKLGCASRASDRAASKLDGLKAENDRLLALVEAGTISPRTARLHYSKEFNA